MFAIQGVELQLNGQEQKAAKITAMDLQMDPTATGLQFHRIDRAKDPNFWSLRVNRDLRIIVHRTVASILLCFVAHHTRHMLGPSGDGSRHIRARVQSKSLRYANG